MIIFTKRILETQSEFTSTSKTFTLKVLGNIDSTIKWITPSTLPNLGANRISYLNVVAETTIEGANLRYDFISGKLPEGLDLRAIFANIDYEKHGVVSISWLVNDNSAASGGGHTY